MQDIYLDVEIAFNSSLSVERDVVRQIAKSLSFFSYLLPEGLRGNDFVAFVDAFGVRLYEELDYAAWPNRL